MLRLFGIDITGCTFGLSSLKSSTEDAENNFIHPKHANSFVLHNKLRILHTNDHETHNYMNTNYKQEATKIVSDDYQTLDNVSKPYSNKKIILYRET